MRRGSWSLTSGGAAVLAAVALMVLHQVSPRPAAGQDVTVDEHVHPPASRLAAVESRLTPRERGGPAAPLALAACSAQPTVDPRTEAYRTGFAAIFRDYDAAGDEIRRVAAAAYEHLDITPELLAAGPKLIHAQHATLIARGRTLEPPPCYAATQEILLRALTLLEGDVESEAGHALLGEARTAFSVAHCSARPGTPLK